MFIKCPKIGKRCGFCGESKWNPDTGKHDERKRLFCGYAPASWDMRVDSLPSCPQDMSKSQLSSWRKQQKKRIPLRYLYNKD